MRTSSLIRSACVVGLLSLAFVANGQAVAARHVTSRDGTRIAFDMVGKGPAVIVVGGALSDRAGAKDLAQLLAPNFTVYTYDRRGRGDSTDTKPYSVQREIEDIEALIQNAGGSAYVYGKSSGASLALRAAAEVGKSIPKLALYEPPHDDAQGAAKEWTAFTEKLDVLLAADRRADAITLFMKFVGAPDDAIAKLKASPAWPGMLEMAPTLAYDNAVVGEDRSVPVAAAAKIEAITLVMDGGASLVPMPYMHVTADKLGRTLPNAQRRIVEGQAHDVSATVLAPILVKFFR